MQYEQKLFAECGNKSKKFKIEYYRVNNIVF